MTNMKNIKFIAAGVFSALVAIQATAAPVLAEGIAGRKVGAEITEIVVDLDGAATVELVRTSDEFGIEDLTVLGAEGNPFSIESSGSKLVLKMESGDHFWGMKKRSVRAKFKLLVPAGRALDIAAGTLELSGEAAASRMKLSGGHVTVSGLKASVDDELRISAGKAVLDLDVVSAKRIRIGTGSVSGKMKAPETAKIRNGSGFNGLTVYLREGV